MSLSTNKIIFLLIFLCASIMSIFFIYHMKNAPRPLFSNNNRTIFTVAVDIKPFELGTVQNNKFSNKDFLNHWSLVFFGFSHCSNICPTTLSMLSEVYPALHSHFPNLQVILVSLDPERDKPTVLKAYLKRFHSDFIGVSGKASQLHLLQSQLHVFSERDASSNYQIQHTSSILLINPQGKWAGLFRYGLTPEEFLNEFKGSMEALAA